MRPLPTKEASDSHAERPFMDLASFNRVYLDLIANGQEACAEDLLNRFKVSQYGAFAKVQIHGGERSISEDAA